MKPHIVSPRHRPLMAELLSANAAGPPACLPSGYNSTRPNEFLAKCTLQWLFCNQTIHNLIPNTHDQAPMRAGLALPPRSASRSTPSLLGSTASSKASQHHSTPVSTSQHPFASLQCASCCQCLPIEWLRVHFCSKSNATPGWYAWLTAG